MILLKNIFFASVVIVLLGIIGCISEAVKKKTEISKAYLNLAFFVFISLFFSTLANFTSSSILAMISWGIYCGSYDFALYYFMELVLVMEGQEKPKFRNQLFKKIYSLFTFVDITLLILNIGQKFYFDMIPVYYGDQFFLWKTSYKGLFYFHTAICYLIVLFTVSQLVKKGIRVKEFYRRKFWFMLVMLVLTVLLNGLYVFHSTKWIIDFSVLPYGLFDIFVFSFLIYTVPKTLKKNLVQIGAENVTDAIICFDYNNNCIYKNKAASVCYGEDNSDWVEKYIYSSSDFIMKAEDIEIDGEQHIFNVEFKRLRDDKGRLVCSYLRLNDRTEAIRNMEIMEYKATHDELTGLYSRNFFFSEVERALREEPEIPRYFVCTNIKDFKLVNDLFGSELGDRVLVKQAEMLERARGEGVILGKISGDKFAMLIPKTKFNPKLAERNSRAIKEAVSDLNFNLKIFIGVYEISNPYENVHTMYDKANLAIKGIINDFETTIAFYDTSMMDVLVKEKQVISEFNYAIEEGQFCMFLQPQIDAKSLKCIGAEALVRWYDSNGVYRYPGDFIGVLERSGLIYRLDNCIWEMAAKKINEWHLNGIDDYYISVNISARDFYCGDLYSDFIKLVEKYEISPKKLKLEITESIMIEERNVIRPVLKKLKDYGFDIEMDDFGSGYSSLSVLKDIPVEVLKIDMEFLRRSEHEQRGRLIIASIVKMAKALGMTVITEGVETEEQADFLAVIGVDIFQGYLYSKPVAVYDFEHKYLEERK